MDIVVNLKLGVPKRPTPHIRTVGIHYKERYKLNKNIKELVFKS